MFDPVNVDVITPEALGAQDVALWQSFVAGRGDLAAPYFDVRYVQAAGRVVPEARIARLKNAKDEIIAYLPYQVRGKTLQPLGAPLTDYHGLIAPHGLEIDYPKLLRRLKAIRLEYTGWIGSVKGAQDSVGLTSQVADLSGGYEAYVARLATEHSKFWRNVARCQRNVEKDFGGFDFRFGPVEPEILNWVIDQKRQQYVRSGIHDVFACGWTFDLLAQLSRHGDGDYGLRVGTFHHEGKRVAAEIGLLGGSVLHLWFPAYDTAWQRYGPGILLSLRIMEHMSRHGVTHVDFGAGGEGYKHTMTSPGQTCFEGSLRTRPALLSQGIDAVESLVPSARERLGGVRLSVSRRLRTIRACETEPAGQREAYRALLRRALSRARSMA